MSFNDNELSLIIKKENHFHGFQLVDTIEQPRESSRGEYLLPNRDEIWFKWQQRMQCSSAPSEQRLSMENDEPSDIELLRESDKSLQEIAHDTAILINKLGNASDGPECVWTSDMILSMFTAVPELETLKTLNVNAKLVISLPNNIADELKVTDMAIERQFAAEKSQNASMDDELENLTSGKTLFQGIENLLTVDNFIRQWNTDNINELMPSHLLNFMNNATNGNAYKQDNTSFYDKIKRMQ